VRMREAVSGRSEHFPFPLRALSAIKSKSINQNHN
jgi:hypothetical protein